MQTLVSILADTTPEDSEVVAGPIAFVIWILLILAVVVLGFSLVKQLRKAEAAKAAGLYGDEPVRDEDATDDAPSDRERTEG